MDRPTWSRMVALTTSQSCARSSFETCRLPELSQLSQVLAAGSLVPTCIHSYSFKSDQECIRVSCRAHFTEAYWLCLVAIPRCRTNHSLEYLLLFMGLLSIKVLQDFLLLSLQASKDGLSRWWDGWKSFKVLCISRCSMSPDW